jgi:lipopolysaccharide assembly outer membrane protein LptD (OstA)
MAFFTNFIACKIKITYWLIAFGIYFVYLPHVSGQNDTTILKNIQLVKADRMDVVRVKGKTVNKYKGNVVLKHNEVFLYCDSAYQYPADRQKELEAFGQIKIVQTGSTVLSGNHLFYNTNSQKATMKGNVVLQKNNKVKRRKFLKYSLK